MNTITYVNACTAGQMTRAKQFCPVCVQSWAQQVFRFRSPVDLFKQLHILYAFKIDITVSFYT